MQSVRQELLCPCNEILPEAASVDILDNEAGQIFKALCSGILGTHQNRTNYHKKCRLLNPDGRKGEPLTE